MYRTSSLFNRARGHGRLLPVARSAAAAGIAAAEAAEAAAGTAGIVAAKAAAVRRRRTPAAPALSSWPSSMPVQKPPPPPPPPRVPPPRSSTSRKKMPKRISGQGMRSCVVRPDAMLRGVRRVDGDAFRLRDGGAQALRRGQERRSVLVLPQRGTHVVQQQPGHAVRNECARGRRPLRGAICDRRMESSTMAPLSSPFLTDAPGAEKIVGDVFDRLALRATER